MDSRHVTDPAPPTRLRVLVADDERDIRDLLVLLIETDGFEAVAVGDGQAAVEQARSETFDIAILDVQMPRLDGIGAALKLRREYPQLCIAFHTAMDETWVRSRFDDFELYMGKPLDVASFSARLRACARSPAAEASGRASPAA